MHIRAIGSTCEAQCFHLVRTARMSSRDTVTWLQRSCLPGASSLVRIEDRDEPSPGIKSSVVGDGLVWGESCYWQLTKPAAHEREGSAEDVLTQLGTKEFIHYMHSLHILRLAATKQANLAQLYLWLPECEVLLLASCVGMVSHLIL